MCFEKPKNRIPSILSLNIYPSNYLGFLHLRFERVTVLTRN